MFFFFIIGTHFFNWGSERTPSQMHCSKCGTVSNFIKKKGMRFITLFFIVPVIPLSGVKESVQCPACGTRFQMTP
jgi:DNA-directed RNA polymerase subunit RPC12/RpoP